MAGHAGEQVGEPLVRISVADWIASALDGLPQPQQVRQQVPPEAGSAGLIGPPRALGDALRGLLKNALQASPPGALVTLRAELEETTLRVVVVDQGRGMAPEVLSRVGEPFFTTKVPGEGMGLGLFLTRTLVEQLGGSFRIASHPGEGTEARLELPAEVAGERSST
jgi:two-component system sensor histidine kinase RegB